MKIRIFTITIMLSLWGVIAMGQSLVFHENFEPISGADSVVSSPTNVWSTTQVLSASGLYSDSCTVKLSDTTYLTSNTFSTTGMQYVLLDFDHICKIEFFDAATIEVSNNNGTTWTQLTGGQYLGNAQFANVGNRFNATSYPAWLPTNNNAVPTNSWWKHENFDVSSLLSNTSQAKVRFVLTDVNGTGNAGAYGWLLDNIEVTAAIDELIPPVINLQASSPQDSVFFFGPYSVIASITDNSGIDSALLIYSRNWGPNDTVPMVFNYGNTYTGLIDTIPTFSLYDTICYHVWAMDSSLVHNTSINPSSSCQSFIIYNSQPYPGCTYAVSTFPYIESFDQNFTAGSGSPGSPGTLDTMWTRNPSSASSAYMWLVYNGSTSSSGTGPTGDHTSGSGNYLYTEASYGAAASSTELLSPCVDLNAINVPVLEFYYHMFGTSIGALHVDIWYGNSWVTDIMTPIQGDQGNTWHKMSVNLNTYKGITKIRFRAIKGSSYAGDIAIDDVKIWEPPAYDAGMVSIDRPVSPANTGIQPVKATFANFGSATLNKITIQWQVNGQTQTPYVWTGVLAPGVTADSIVIGQHNFISGPSNIKIWTTAPNDSVDGFNQNDTVQTSVIACTSPLHGVFTIGGASADFMTFTDAIYAIVNCGIDSAITFYVNSGTYVEQLEIDTIPGASIQNSITFQSANGDSTGVILNFSPNSSMAPHVVKFKGGSHITFKNITISATGTSYGRLFLFEDDASYNSVENCILIMPSGSYYYTNAAYAVSTKSEYNSFINNDISNGYYTFYFSTGSSTSTAKGNRFIKNNMHGFRYYAAYLQYQDSFIFMGNTLVNDTSATSAYPLYVYRGAGGFRVENNNIQAHGSSTIYGLRLYYCTSTTAAPAVVANNMISLTGNSTYPYGLYIYNCINMNIYYNTVNVNVGTAPNGRALYQSSGSNIRLKNNIFANNSDGYVAYFGTSAAIIESDYNDYYASAQNFAYWSGTGYVNNLADLQTASNKEAHSVSLAPSFVSNSDLHLTYSPINNLGTPIPSILTDIDGELRSATTPAIGADEQPPIPIDAGVLSIISPSASEAEGDSMNVIVILKNFGTDTLYGFDYSYDLNGIPQDTQTTYMVMPPLSTDTVSFPKFIISPGHNNICVNTLLSADTNNYNNHLCKYFYGVPIIDMGVVKMETPDSGQCLTNSETLLITIKNYGSQTLNMSQIPITIHTTVTGPISVTIPDKILNTGSLSVGTTQLVTLTTQLDMNHTGDYIFDIWTTVSGDGDHTNDSMRTKKISAFATVVTYPYSQAFENFVVSANSTDPGVLEEGWAQQTTGSDFTWFVGSNSTYTNSTGPTADHTLGTASGKYAYAEATGYYAATVNLVSPCINLSSMTHPTLRYWYHMYGSNIHSLRVDVFAGNQWHYSLGHVMGQQQSASSDPWKQDIVDLSSFAGQTVKLRFRAIKLIGYEADIAIDDIFVYEPVQKDAGISNNFQQPATNFAAEGSQVPVEVKIENYGLDTLKDIYVGYIAGNGVPVIEHWTGSIPPYSYQLHLFTKKYTVQAGETTIRAFTSYNGDMNHNNDTGSFAFTGISVLNVPYTDDFEGKNYFVSTGGLKQWQRGNPNKTTFTSPHSGNNAWVTSLIDVYLNNSNDYLYTPFFNLSSFPGTYLRFWHRLETQATHDGGMIEYSTDGGVTFTSLGYISDPASTNWYNANIGGTHAWSSADSGWVQSTYNLSLIPSGIPVQFRFKFFSDNTINNYDGWMIDDFEISPNPISTDGGISKLISPLGYTTSGNSITVSVELKNYGTATLTQIPVNYRIDNGSVVTQNWMGSLAPGAVTNFTFTSNYTAAAAYTLEAWTSVTGDSHWFNDSVKVEMALDAGVIAIINPKPVNTWTDTIDVVVQFKNFGNDTLKTCDMYYDVNGGGGVTETWNGVLPPESSMLYTFNQKYIINYGITNFCAKTLLTGDTKTSNDKICQYINGTIGIPNEITSSFSVSQNIPNPFNNSSEVNINLPNAGNFAITITDITGKVISYQEIKGKRGKNTVKIDGQELSQGVYFYKVKYKGESAVRKMIIIE